MPDVPHWTPQYHFYEKPENITLSIQINDIQVYLEKGYIMYVMNERGTTIDTIIA